MLATCALAFLLGLGGGFGIAVYVGRREAKRRLAERTKRMQEMVDALFSQAATTSGQPTRCDCATCTKRREAEAKN